MSYSLKYERMTVNFGESGYDYCWPNALSETGKELIKKIIYDYNKVAFELESDNGTLIDYSNNIYFLVFEEGAVLFCIRENEGIACSHASVMGMYIEMEYLSTAWLMFDKLIAFVRAYDFCEDSLGGTVYESELDFVYESTEGKNDYLLALNGKMVPYSFAVASLNPKIDGVKYYPIEVSLDKVIHGLDFFKSKSLENVFSSKYIYSEGLMRLDASEYSIERYKDEGVKKNLIDFSLWKNREKRHSIWVMRRGINSLSNSRIFELKCLDSEKMVRFSRILATMNAMSENQNGGGTNGRTIINKL